MTTKNDGGPAFPRPAGDYNGTRHGNSAQTGISMRDYFAAKAMQGLMPVLWGMESKFESGSEIVRYQVETAYEYADAMLKERENKS